MPAATGILPDWKLAIGGGGMAMPWAGGGGIAPFGLAGGVTILVWLIGGGGKPPAPGGGGGNPVPIDAIPLPEFMLADGSGPEAIEIPGLPGGGGKPLALFVADGNVVPNPLPELNWPGGGGNVPDATHGGGGKPLIPGGGGNPAPLLADGGNVVPNPLPELN